MRIIFNFFDQPLLIFSHAKKIIMFFDLVYLALALRTVSFRQVFLGPEPFAGRAIPSFIAVSVNLIPGMEFLENVAD